MSSDLDDATNRAAYWSDAALTNTEFLAAHYTDFVFPPHFHETFAIGIIVSGGQRFRQERGDATIMPEGKLCVINPGVVHEGRSASKSGWNYRMIYPSADVIAAALKEDVFQTVSRGILFDANVLDDPELYHAFDHLHQSSQHQESMLEREVRCLIFLETLFSRHAIKSELQYPKRMGRKSVEGVREFLHAHWNEDIRTNQLSALVDCSPTHAIRAFSQDVGLPPHKYITALRVERVKEMLRAGGGLSESATAAGFYDQSQMNRHFKLLTGVTPGTYLKAHL